MLTILLATLVTFSGPADANCYELSVRVHPDTWAGYCFDGTGQVYGELNDNWKDEAHVSIY
jgi:hypothetical protein